MTDITYLADQDMEELIEKIKQQSDNEMTAIEIANNSKPSNCSCNKCKAMCKTAPCFGTPSDIALIFLAGHGHKLALTTWAGALKLGIMKIYEMIQPKFDETTKRCVFLNKDDLCDLHDVKLKPIGGKLANCDIEVYSRYKVPIELMVAEQWETPWNKWLVDILLKKVQDPEAKANL
jgi:hypothetical protein